MSTKKPTPLIPHPTRKICPVCGESSYSSAGVHPQCSARQADARRMERIKADRKAGAGVRPAATNKAWQKSCPKCQSSQPLRKKVCDCGHTFAVRARPIAGQGDAS